MSESSEKKKSNQYCIRYENVLEAAGRIEGIAHRTPVLCSSSMNVHGKKFFFKAEALQRTGSFKFRGALNAILTELEGRSKDTETASLAVVTHSSGNHAAALALAAKLASPRVDTTEPTPPRKIQATIVMPRNTPQVKLQAVQGFGGTIVLVDNTNQARESEAERIATETGAVFVHPSEDKRVIAGQGTTSLEFVEQVRELLGQGKSSPANSSDDLDAVIVPVGGGGLAAGNTIALRAMLGDKVKIILAEPSELDDAHRSFRAGTLMGHHTDNKLDSVADGLKTTLGPNTWPIVRDLVDDIITVTEEDILRCTKLVWERLKICIEPSSGVGVAVALGAEFNQKYTTESGIRNVGIILCGGNVDILKISERMMDIGLG